MKKKVTFLVEPELYKKYQKACLDNNTRPTYALNEHIKAYVESTKDNMVVKNDA